MPWNRDPGGHGHPGLSCPGGDRVPLPKLNCWRRGGESNPRIKVLQTSALPLGYRAEPDERAPGSAAPLFARYRAAADEVNSWRGML